MFTSRKVNLPLYELGMIASTRALLGLGIGLLVGEHLDRRQRRILGTTLTIVGAVSTLPLGMDVLHQVGLLRGESKAKTDFGRLGEDACQSQSREAGCYS